MSTLAMIWTRMLESKGFRAANRNPVGIPPADNRLAGASGLARGGRGRAAGQCAGCSRLLFGAALITALAGCAVPAPRSAPPVPLTPPVAAAVPVPEPMPVIAPEPAPAPPAPVPAPPPAPTAPAALTLAAQSDAALATGDLLRAEQHLERALRIAPRDPELWHRMARVRLAQADYQQAERMASRSLQLSVGDRNLAAANWRLIAQARSALGDAAGAARARAEAERLESVVG